MPLRASQPGNILAAFQTAFGKTAPKFLHDLLRFDPQSIHANRNILIDDPPQYDGKARSGPALVLDRGSCKHEYYSHLERCNLPHLDESAQQDTCWKVAASCKKCRLYLTLSIDYPESGCKQPCPNQDYPLHHLRHIETNPSGVGYHFGCSNFGCQALVHVVYEAPVLSKEDVLLLSDGQALSRRYEAVLDNTPDREGVRLANPLDVYTRLKRYVSDSLLESNARRSFPARNKRFMEAFGTECDSLLLRLGFEKAEDGDSEHQWKLPSPKPVHDSDPLRLTLERLVLELQYLMDDYCASNAKPNPSRPSYRDAKVDLARTLSAQGYDKVPGRNLASSEADHPCYASLGALGDFSDGLIEYCYERQTTCDPQEGPHYFDCLQDLATGRSSEQLILKSSKLASQNVLSKKDIDQAYKALGIDPDRQKTVGDEEIIGIYKSRWSSSGPTGRSDLKVALRTLGNARSSRPMLDAAADTVETYEQALAWLDANESQADDTIIALYGVKVDDSHNDPMTKDLARRAVDIIAKQRKSEMLHSWLATGEMTSSTMSLEDACKHFELEDLDKIDPDTLEAVFLVAPPGTTTDRATATIRKAMADQNAGKPSHSTETWPVGLISHGNTCYLNSLLQYYFTVKPLRELVLNFDKYKYDLAAQGAKHERVGNLHRPEYEIESFQSLTNDLRHLFERMIRDRGPAVRPEADLVCRAFLKPTSPEADTTGAQRDESADVNMTSAENVNTPGTVEESAMISQASSTTLQGDATLTPPATPKGEKEGELLAPPLPPRRPATPSQTSKTNLEKAEEAARQQQDVAEVMEELLTRLRASIKPLGQDSQGEQMDQLRDIFNMRIADTIVAEGEETSTKEDDFTNLMLLPPYEPTNIYSALDRVLDLHPEPNANKPVSVYKTFKSFPPILQISINRILLDRHGKPAKSEHSIKIEEYLYMDRYSEDEAILARRKQCWEWRRRLRGLQAEKDIIQKTKINIDGPSTLDGISDWLSTIPDVDEILKDVGVDPVNVPEGLASNLQQETIFQRARLTDIAKEVRELEDDIAKQFSGPEFEKLKYRLHAVFFHRGSTGHGHYWTYIYDIHHNIWRLYNDEIVEEFTKINEILNAEGWHQGTPTYAVYVRDDTKEQYVEPLRRDVEELVDEPMPDAAASFSAAPTQTSSVGFEGDWKQEPEGPQPVEINW
ncbi:cysteine proteinase [Aureobasidium pullulans]|uniref:ubiquitinyl hydrolase 1 n=1 Tax=Aureobasidium pullulans TaxID=5580 RepID=A0A4S8Z1F7_AURPU|nr:cysteine proteinase [Aureobasidium pullulans]